MTYADISNVTVVGGGRWGLVICSVLDNMLPPTIPIWLVSRHLSVERVPQRVRRILTIGELPKPDTNGAAIVATAPHDHAQTAAWLLSAGWHVMIEKPATLNVCDAEMLVGRATEVKRHAWVSLVYLFASYLPIMKPYVEAKSQWLLEWCEPDQEMRWGEFKSTPHHVNMIEDIFPHAWSILRSAGLVGLFQFQQVETMNLRSVRLTLTAGEASVVMMLDRHAGYRRRCLRMEAGGHNYELDFSEEPGVFRIDDVVGKEPPFDPERRPLARQLSSFLDACSGGPVPDAPIMLSQNLEAVALMEEATKAFLAIQAREIASAAFNDRASPEVLRVLFDALCREAAIAGKRLEKDSDEGHALMAAACAIIRQEDTNWPELTGDLAAIVRASPFLARVRQERGGLVARRH